MGFQMSVMCIGILLLRHPIVQMFLSNPSSEIYHYSDLFLMIQAVQAVIKEEARDNYRQNIMRPAALSKVNEELREVPCTILNVSATGIALQSPGLFQIGDILELTRQRFRVRGPEHTVKCKVVRMRGLTEGGYFYGCQFVELTQEEENRLYQDMFALQAAEMYKQRNPRF